MIFFQPSCNTLLLFYAHIVYTPSDEHALMHYVHNCIPFEMLSPVQLVVQKKCNKIFYMQATSCYVTRSAYYPLLGVFCVKTYPYKNGKLNIYFSGITAELH